LSCRSFSALLGAKARRPPRATQRLSRPLFRNRSPAIVGTAHAHTTLTGVAAAVVLAVPTAAQVELHRSATSGTLRNRWSRIAAQDDRPNLRWGVRSDPLADSHRFR